MNLGLARLLVRLYPRAWRERYGVEFEVLLADGGAELTTVANVVWSALRERVSPRWRLKSGDNMDLHRSFFPFQSWCVRAPWAVVGLAPLLLLAAAYFVACFILWSGWRIFLPGAETPFVPIEGFAIFYFGVGRLLYESAPILVGWGIVLIAARQRLKALWPLVGLTLIALTGGMAQVHVSSPASAGAGRVSMGFLPGDLTQGIAAGLPHAAVILTVALLPWLAWRVRRSLAA